MRVRWTLVILAVLALPMASAQLNSCGDGFELFIRNPDVGAAPDGKFHVSGDLFIQFQVIGDAADQIETFAFSVGLPVENPEEICTLPVWPGGLMLEAYKADTDGSDGFFILMRTNEQSTPQNIDLSAAVHAYDADGNELARFWGMAIVENCPDPGPGCDAETAQGYDQTMPWPIILPGDGSASLVDGFTVEFAEPLAGLQVLLNNQDVTQDMTEWSGRDWDLDTYWDYGPMGVFGTATPMCSLPAVHNCGPPRGPAYEWTDRPVTDDDVIRVVATDMNGNIAKKEIHIGSSVAGGTIADGLPILQMTAEEPTLTVPPGGVASFQMILENNGGGEGHPFAQGDVPPGWDYAWVPGHEPVPAGGSSRQAFEVTVPANATEGSYDALAIMDYRQGSVDKRIQSPVTVVVAIPEDAPEPRMEAEPEKESSIAGILPVVALLGAAWAATKRS